MQHLKAWIKSFFGFSRGETNAFLILLPLLAALLFSGPVYRWWFDSSTLLPSAEARVDSLIATWKWDIPREETPPPSFHFNPNTSSEEEFVKLGFSEKLSKRIVNFRTKGGRFQIKSDLGKIYGMDSALMIRLTSFIDLPDKKIAEIRKVETKIAQSGVRFDLNLADSIQLIGIYGIGPKRARTILNYREKLGGFVSLEQLKEVYGIDSTVMVQLKQKLFIREGFLPRQININNASEKSLTSLPYIKWNLAKAIAAYRFQHGNFNNLDALHELVLIDEPLFEKIKPYLTVKDSL